MQQNNLKIKSLNFAKFLKIYYIANILDSLKVFLKGELFEDHDGRCQFKIGLRCFLKYFIMQFFCIFYMINIFFFVKTL